MEGLAASFEDLADPRAGNAGRHDLVEIMVIALCTVQYASDMELFAREKEAFLRQFLKLEKGLPSHDTFSWVFRLLDPEQFSACFQKFMCKLSQACQGVIAIDVKVLLCHEGAKAPCCTRDEGGPFGAALQEEAPNCHELLRSKAAVVNVMVKRRGNDRVMYLLFIEEGHDTIVQKIGAVIGVLRS